MAQVDIFHLQSLFQEIKNDQMTMLQKKKKRINMTTT